MRLKVFSAVLLAGVGFSSTSIAQTVGSAADVHGSVVVVRGDESLALINGSKLRAGDRIVSHEASSVQVNAFGCETEVPAQTTIVVGDDMCGLTPVSFSTADLPASLTSAAATNTANLPVAAAASFAVPSTTAAAATLLATPAILSVARGDGTSVEFEPDEDLTPVSP